MSDIDSILCDLGHGCWDKPCDKLKCAWNIDYERCSNCFLLYKYTLKDKYHTLSEIGKILRISHATVKQIEGDALKKLKENRFLQDSR